MDVANFITYLFLVLSGLVVGYWLFYRDRSHEESTRGKLGKENSDLRRSLQNSQVAFKSLEEKFGRQRGQLNVLQKLCDDWSSSRETNERERAQLEADLGTKSTRISSIESDYRDEKQKRIKLEDQVHQLAQEMMAKKAEVEELWRGKHATATNSLTKQTADLQTIKAERKQISKQLHDAKARIAELESEIKSSKNLIETATANATGLKQEYVSLETGLKSTNDQLKRALADAAKAVSRKEAALAVAAKADKQVEVLEKETKSLSNQRDALQQKLETKHAALAKLKEQLVHVTEQRDQAMKHEKAAGIVSSGLQKRLDNQESTIHVLRQSQDDALENLKHELKIRTEMEAKFDTRSETIRKETEKMRKDYEAQIEALRKESEDMKSEHAAQFKSKMKSLRDESEKMRKDYEAQIEALRKESEDMKSEHAAQFKSKMKSLRDESETIKTDYAAKYELQLTQLRTQSEKQLAERNSEYETQIKDLRDQLGRQSAQYAEHSRDLREQLKQQREELTPLTTRCTTLESEASTYSQSIVKLDAKREQIQLELDATRQQMQSQLKQDSETIGELQRERNELQKELEKLQNRISPLQEKVDSQRRFVTELEMNQARVADLERSLAQRDQESKRLHAQANELERLRQRYQEARERQDVLQGQLDEMVSRQIGSESDRSNLVARISELEARLNASLETIEDLRKERALVLATLADQRTTQEPDATIISFTQSMQPEDVKEDEEEDSYDAEYGGRMRRDANRGMVFTEAPESSDDLKRISGIAEVLEKRLNDFGVYTFKQVMEWKTEEIDEFSRLLAFRDRIVRDDWQGQARFFYNQKRKGARSAA